MERLKIVHRPMQPPHDKQPRRNTMRHKYRRRIRPIDALTVLPKGGCECRDAIEYISTAFSIRKAEEKSSEIFPFLLGLLDQFRILKVSKVLLSQSRLFSGEQHVAGNMMLQFVVGLLGPSVRADVEHDGCIADNPLEGRSRPSRLQLAFVQQWYLPIRQSREEGFVLVAERTAMAQEQYLLREAGSYCLVTVGTGASSVGWE